MPPHTSKPQTEYLSNRKDTDMQISLTGATFLSFAAFLTIALLSI